MVKLLGAEQRADEPTTAFTPTESSTWLPVKSTSNASSSPPDLTSVIITSVPKPKAPIGAIAGGTIGDLAVLCLIGFAPLFFRKWGAHNT